MIEDRFFNGDVEKDIKIGCLIKEKYSESGLSIEEFANRIFCKRGNVYRIFERSRIDVDLLLNICKALNYNFFKSYYAKAEQNINHMVKRKGNAQVQLQIDIPIEEIELKNICKYCEVNRLNKKQEEEKNDRRKI